MFPILPLALAGAALAAGALFARQRRQPRTLMDILTAAPPVRAAKEPSTTSPLPPARWLAPVSRRLGRLDERFQEMIGNRLDPWLMGRQRAGQMRTLTQNEQRKIGPRERRTNRSLALGSGALGLIGLVHLCGAWPLLPVVLAVGLYNVWPLIKEGYRMAVDERRLSILHLMLVYFAVLWFGGFYLVGVIGLIFANLCQKIALLTQATTSHALTHLLGQQPQRVWVILDGVEIEIPFEQLRVGHVLVLDAGQPVPVDGVIVQGAATIDQHRLTGESQPAEKGVGDPVLATTLVLGGRLRVRVEKTGTETAAARIGEILERTVERQEVRLADQFRSLEKTRLPMLAGSALGWLIGGPRTAAAMLGCNYLFGMVPLGLVTLLNGLKAGARHGILVKDGRALERLPAIDTLVFDKTGTLTLNQLRVVRLYPGPGHSEDALLTLAAAAEHRQTHPIARAILAEAAVRGLNIPAIAEARYELGYGLNVWLDGRRVRVGSLRFMDQEGIDLPAGLRMAHHAGQGQGHSLVFVAMEADVVGAIELAATLRPEARPVIDWLKRRGLEMYILSGDQDTPTRKLAAELGMAGYFANTLPKQKAERLRELQAQGRRVCFVGDGINDAIALREADVSISLRGATTVATDAAQIVLMDDDLAQLRTLWELAAGYQRAIAANTGLATLGSFLAAAGVLLLQFKFGVVELLWGVQFSASLRIANRSLLDNGSQPTATGGGAPPSRASAPAAPVDAAEAAPPFPLNARA